tara:strand:- start:38647 stop:41307 length:2661 start_codon:yes stop_codon:yes gene_type:complete
MQDSYKTKSILEKNSSKYCYFSLKKLPNQELVSKLPYTLKILLENLLRFEDGVNVTKDTIDALLSHATTNPVKTEIAFTPSRVILQDFTGVPAVVDLAAMRDAISKLGGDPTKINPLQPVELVIDHSVQVDKFGNEEALKLNSEIEYRRNKERYQFLKWGQQAFSNFKVVPPETGIVHQVNLEYLARVVFSKEIESQTHTHLLYPDTVVGTDSHTTMINGLGVLGWGVGGIEAEAAMLGQPISMLIPEVVGFELTGELKEGITATDLVLTVVEILRKKEVVGKFVEFFGKGLQHLSLADRATISNMAPEYGATCGFFPIDNETVNYLKLSNRDADHIELIKEYAKEQGLWFDADSSEYSVEKHYSDVVTLDLNTIVPSISGPKRPQDRIELTKAKSAFNIYAKEQKFDLDSKTDKLSNGSIVVAAITSCTNTSNPEVMLGAGLLAKKAAQKGLSVPKWVKTSLAPGSKVVTDYLKKANLLKDLNKLGFNLVGYGCTTCIGNSGPLDESISKEINDKGLYVCSVLSGNRNFEGRIHPEVRMNYLASPPLVVAYALAGTMNIDLYKDPLGVDTAGNNVYLADIWPSKEELQDLIQTSLQVDMFKHTYDSVFEGDDNWKNLPTSEGDVYDWDAKSTYIQNPPYFKNMPKTPKKLQNISDAKVLVKLSDSITTDHISPAGAIKVDSPAGKYLNNHDVNVKDFNSYGSRRGNHEVMMRGTFANIRLKNQLAPGTEGCWTTKYPENQVMSIYDAAVQYEADNIPLVVLAGKEYGTGSSRDWAAKGPCLLGVKVVIAESYERIHRSNLIGMGILPLQFLENNNADTLGLTGNETFNFIGIANLPQDTIKVEVLDDSGKILKEFNANVRLDTPKEVEYYKHGGILHYVLRNLLD